jgi:glycosyltransferase involved in cell wall biosynthesis
MTLIENAHVTIIVPCRNEARHIATCLNSIIGNTFDKNRMQVLVVDGMSEDGTREQVKAFSAKYPFVQILSDTKQTTPSALNLGISNATSEIIVRMDAHARYPENYIEKLLEWMERSGADNVGGVVVTQAGADTLFARAIAMAISHPFGVGNAYFRIGTREPRWVDTVPFGCYRKAQFSLTSQSDCRL